MPSPSGSARLALASGLLAVLACGLAADEARAAPIPTRITDSTSGSDVIPDPSPASLDEFRPATDGIATLGSDLKPGTIIVHRQEEPPYTQLLVLARPFAIEFRVTKVGDDTLPSGGESIRIDNDLDDEIRDDGSVVGDLEPFLEGQCGPIQVGPLSLTLKPIAVPPTWDRGPDDT